MSNKKQGIEFGQNMTKICQIFFKAILNVGPYKACEACEATQKKTV